jgi:hypothetical protein
MRAIQVMAVTVALTGASAPPKGERDNLTYADILSGLKCSQLERYTAAFPRGHHCEVFVDRFGC